VHDFADLPARLSQLVAEPVAGGLPERLCRFAVEVLGATGGSLVVLGAAGERTVLATSDRTAEAFEDLQDMVLEGPGIRARRHGRPVTVALDVSAPEDDAFWALAARTSPHHTIHAIPMTSDGQTFGVLTLYTAPGRPLTRSATEVQHVVDAIGQAVLAAAATEGLDGTALSRARVNQATGALMAQLRIPADDALALLRASAFARSVGLEQHAGEVLDGTVTLPGPLDPGHG
jgi:transcriptional regulator with GAF, ATPase, and Fis domain